MKRSHAILSIQELIDTNLAGCGRYPSASDILHHCEVVLEMLPPNALEEPNMLHMWEPETSETAKFKIGNVINVKGIENAIIVGQENDKWVCEFWDGTCSRIFTEYETEFVLVAEKLTPELKAEIVGDD